MPVLRTQAPSHGLPRADLSDLGSLQWQAHWQPEACPCRQCQPGLTYPWHGGVEGRAQGVWAGDDSSAQGVWAGDGLSSGGPRSMHVMFGVHASGVAA
jgi:hypothetical protein